MPSPEPQSPPDADSFADAVRNALATEHRHLAQPPRDRPCGLAAKYPADIAPFASLAANTAEALADLRQLLTVGEHTWLMHDAPHAVPGLTHDSSIACLQMLYPRELPLPEAANTAAILPLNSSHAAEMVALTDVAFPGFFRPRTHVMGHYFGIRDAHGRLIAMCGERMVCSTPDLVCREISALCTHPEHRGRGHAAQLLRKLITVQRALDAASVLHVASANTAAVALYHRLGFLTLREVVLHRVTRTA